MDKEKYVKWYNLARKVVGNEETIPDRNQKEILDFISPKEFLIFAPAWINSMEEAKNSPIPNVFFDLDSIYLKERNGRLGLTFNNIKAVENFRNILSNCCRGERDELTTALLSLESFWQIKVERKIRKHPEGKPIYKSELEEQTNKIDGVIIKKIFEVSDRIREEGKQNREKEKLNLGKSRVAYMEVPSINLMESVFELTKENFESRIKEIFNILAICLRVKDIKKIKEITQEKKILLEELVKERQKITWQLQNKDFFNQFKKINNEEIIQLENKLKEINKKIDELQRDI